MKLLTCPRIAIALIHPYFCTEREEDCEDDQNFKQVLHGADRVLFQILSEKFEVRIVPVFIEKEYSGRKNAGSTSSYFCDLHSAEVGSIGEEAIDFYMLNHSLYNAVELSPSNNMSHLVRAMYITPKKIQQQTLLDVWSKQRCKIR